jgi:hypothetical protein
VAEPALIPSSRADAIKEVFGQLAALALVDLDAKYASAPDIHHHIEVIVLTLDGTGH